MSAFTTEPGTAYKFVDRECKLNILGNQLQGRVPVNALSRLTSISLSRLALYTLEMLSTFSFGSPRSSSSLLRTVYETWNMTEFVSMKQRVETTAFIQQWSRPVPVSSFTVLALCIGEGITISELSRQWATSCAKMRRILTAVQLWQAYYLGQHGDLCDEPLGTADVATELEAHYQSIISYYSHMLLLLLLCTLASAKTITIPYNHSLHTITLYNSKGAPIRFTLTFDSQDISMHQSLRSSPLYLQSNHKHKLEVDKYARYDFKVREGQVQEGSMGSIGLKEGSTFFTLLAQSFNSQVKLEVKHKEGTIGIVEQPCRYPLFPPLQLTLSQTTTHSYTIQALSTNFVADSSLLKIVGKDKNPFEMGPESISSEVTLSVRDRITSVPIKELFSCGKYSNSDSYECQANTKGSVDMGSLLLYFDPILCRSGIELHRSMDDSWGFHYSHIALLLLQFAVLGVLVNEERVLAVIGRMTGRHKNY